MKADARAHLIEDFSQKRGSYFQENYVRATPANQVRRVRRERILAAVGALPDQATVLDAGCGPAILFPELLDRCQTYTAVDLVPSNLEEVRRAHPEPRVQTILSDLDSFAWPQGTCDAVICSGAIEYTGHPDTILEGMISALKPGGVLVCSFPNAWSPYRMWSQWVYTPASLMARRLAGRKVNSYKRRLFRPGKIAALAKKSGVEPAIQYFGFKLLLQPFDQLLPKLDQSVVLRYERVSPGVIAPLGSEFLLVARKCR